MTTLDIRNNKECINRIKWGGNDYVNIPSKYSEYITIEDSGGCEATVSIDEISDLIKALQKAKELWLDKT